MGPTASGKTPLSVQLAHALGGEIISVDSALAFKGVGIGTAKPTVEERGGIPHQLMIYWLRQNLSLLVSLEHRR